MFGIRMIDPLKTTTESLASHAPDAAMWPALTSYLVRGRRPGDPAAQEALDAYLELRDSLGALAAFRAGAALSHDLLAEPCREHFRARRAAGLGGKGLEHWARFLLAADYLLGRAFEARAQKGKDGKGIREALAREVDQVAAAYLEPLAADCRRRSGQAAMGQRRTDAAPGLAAASAA